MSEFTGERVIPGQVSVDLWNEHMARYAFAARFAGGVRALDLGCGTGYGAASLAQVAHEVVGVDFAADAVEYARKNFPLSNVRFEQSSATQVAEPDAGFDLITAFEIIEHIADWREMLKEARRLLRKDGRFLVSTPNIRYYAESRGVTGPNPFHVHEFAYDEFAAALREHFTDVHVLLQNRVEAFAFHPYRVPWPADGRVEGSAGSTDDAHFFLAVCSIGKPVEQRSFVYVPRAANLLREREQHVALLETELAQNRAWLQQTQKELARLLTLHAEQKEQLEANNRWGLKLTADWNAGLARIAALQQELQAEQQSARAVVEQYEAKVREVESENVQKTEWALDTEQRLHAEIDEKSTALEKLHALEVAFENQTRRAQSLQAGVERLQSILTSVGQSRWVKIGRTVGLGPKVDSE